MSFLTRTALRGSTSRMAQVFPPSSAVRRAGFSPLPRFASTLQTANTSPSQTTATSAASPGSTPAIPATQELSTDKKMGKITSQLALAIPKSQKTTSAAADPTSEEWWMNLSREGANPYHPSKFFSGRSVDLKRGAPFMAGFKRLQNIMRNGNMKKEARLMAFHEKPSVRKRRLRSERHRKRFKEMVRSKVQQVLALRGRG